MEADLSQGSFQFALLFKMGDIKACFHDDGNELAESEKTDNEERWDHWRN